MSTGANRLPEPGRAWLALLWIGAACAAIYAIEGFVAAEVGTSSRPGLLAAAMILDLCLFVPIVVWFGIGRRRGWSPLRLVPLVVIGLVFSTLMIPEEGRGAVDVAHLLAVPLELGLLGLIAWRAAAVVRAARRNVRSGQGDTAEALCTAATDVMGHRRVGAALGYEAAVIAYAFGLAPKDGGGPGTRAFTHHRSTAYPAVVLTVLMVAIVETVGVHLLVQMWSPPVAWVLTAIGLYALLWIVADLRALSRRPSLTGPAGLELRLGLRWTLRVPWSQVARTERISENQIGRKKKDALRLILLGGPTHRILLSRPMTAVGPYGIERQVTTIELSVDDAAEFDRQIARHAPEAPDQN